MEPIECQDCLGSGRQSWDDGDVEQTGECGSCMGRGEVIPSSYSGCESCFWWITRDASAYSSLLCPCGVKHDTTRAKSPSELLNRNGFVEVG